MKYLFVRHAESEFNAGITRHYDSDLTPEGVSQCKKLCENNYFRGLESYYVSPFLRCLRTANYISRHNDGLPFVVDPDIGSLPSDSDLEDKVIRPDKHLFRHFIWPEEDEFSYVGEIDNEEIYIARIQRFVDKLRKHSSALVVGHSVAMKLIIKMLSGREIWIRNTGVYWYDGN